MSTVAEIEKILSDGDLALASGEVRKLLESEPENGAAWYLQGNIYRRQQQWGDAINAYNKAKQYDPACPADAAVESIYDIIRFVNTDLMNP